MKNKKLSLLLALLLIINATLPVLASGQIEDLSSDHWAYQSVVELVERGYMSLYEDNKFQGEDEVTRYELAEIIAKMLENIEQGRVTAEEDDMLTLKKLATEFREELVELMQQNKELEEGIEGLEQEQLIIREDLIKTNDRVNDLGQQASEIIKDLEEESTKIMTLQTQVEQLQSENKALRSHVEDLEQGLGTTGSQEEIDRLNRRFFWLAGGTAVTALLLLGN
ncbi:S-layer homology domain-containing protein [Natroniella sulfidigena]|uniref:S-layer homology domain-containing protein n=1 Tax=Natroniella sulfidigena TaxID=723921 RepID=UPI00200A664A|nr:S-layer homology domain-containing protein [Natroniella sulfidigena]MCK8817704.1 S-layer homology domain-containing protein [Natroniella sulfidigena]